MNPAVRAIPFIHCASRHAFVQLVFVSEQGTDRKIIG